MSKIFISYSRLDSEFVDRLIGELGHRGFDVWVDTKDIGGGADWAKLISQAIRNCQTFLLVLSPNSADSKKVVQELSLADQYGCQIIPIVAKACDIPDDMALQLSGLQRVDFTRYTFADGIDAIESSLTNKTVRRKPIKPSPEDIYQPPEPPIPPKNPVLHELLPGQWQIQIMHPMTGMMGQLTLLLLGNGTFQGQLFTPMGQTAVQGMWQITPLNQLVLQGQQSNGFQTIPYYVCLQFNSITSTYLTGFTGGGEQVACQKTG